MYPKVDPKVNQKPSPLHGGAPAYQEVAKQLRASILRGEILPAEKILQDETATALGVSRMPVREALRVLEREGFVRLIPNRGAIVRELSIQDIREVYQIRIELEGLAARLAAPLAADEQIRELRHLVSLMREASEHDDIHRLLELNKRFHETCYRSAQNARLLRAIDDLRNYSLRYRVFHAHIPHRLRDSLAEHVAILEAFEKRDSQLAETRTEHNMQRTADVLVEHLERSWGVSSPVVLGSNRRHASRTGGNS